MIWYDVSRHIIALAKIQNIDDILSSMSNLQPNWCLKIDLQKVDQHAGGKWLIHDTKICKDNQFQSLKLPLLFSPNCEEAFYQDPMLFIFHLILCMMASYVKRIPQNFLPEILLQSHMRDGYYLAGNHDKYVLSLKRIRIASMENGYTANMSPKYLRLKNKIYRDRDSEVVPSKILLSTNQVGIFLNWNKTKIAVRL